MRSHSLAGPFPAGKSLWSAWGLAALLESLASIALGVGTFLLGRSGGAPQAGMLALLAATVWIGLASAPLAAGGKSSLSAFVRGGVLADASVVTLLVVGLGGGRLGFLGGLEVYAIWVGMAVSLALLTRLARSDLGRAGLAVAGSTVMALAMGSLFWTGGLLSGLSASARQAAASCVVWTNPIVGVSLAAGPHSQLIWNWPVMYNLTRLGQDVVVPPVAWWQSACVWWTLVVALGVFLGLRRLYRRFMFGH